MTAKTRKKPKYTAKENMGIQGKEKGEKGGNWETSTPAEDDA